MASLTRFCESDASRWTTCQAHPTVDARRNGGIQRLLRIAARGRTRVQCEAQTRQALRTAGVYELLLCYRGKPYLSNRATWPDKTHQKNALTWWAPPWRCHFEHSETDGWIEWAGHNVSGPIVRSLPLLWSTSVHSWERAVEPDRLGDMTTGTMLNDLDHTK